MKKPILLLLFSLRAIISYAQVEWSIFSGPQVTSAQYIIRAQKQAAEIKYGFHFKKKNIIIDTRNRE